MSANKIILRRGIHVGQPAAEDDTVFLKECFIDLNLYKDLKDTESSKSILLGRTGSGKSALLQVMLLDERNCAKIDPKEIAIEYFANTDIIAFLINNGFDLNLLFEVMWKHIFILESVNLYFENKNVLEKALSRLYDQGNPARAYFDKYKDRFWNETDIVLQELSDQFSSEVKESVALTLGIDANNFGLESLDSEKLSKGQRFEIEKRTKEAISHLQLRELARAIDSLNALMENQQKNYYILIDDLDLNWAENNLRYQVIYSLISVLKPLRKIRNVKFICALRKDLYEKVLLKKTGETFQSEKFEGITTEIYWEKSELIKMLEKRLNYIFKHKYNKATIKTNEIIPSNVRKLAPTLDFLVERTQYRPRDLIAFFNIILDSSAGSTEIHSKKIIEAELEYSRKRSEALKEEWHSVHPHLETYLDILNKKTGKIEIREFFDRDMVMDLCLKLSDSSIDDKFEDEVQKSCRLYAKRENEERMKNVVKSLLSVLHKVGAIELKLASGDPFIAVYKNSPTIDARQISDTAAFKVTPMLWRSLGITPNL